MHAIVRPGPDGLAELGSLGPLPCWGASLAPAPAAALARRLAARGVIGLLIADEPTGSRRALAVTVMPCHVVVVPRTDLEALPILRLRRVSQVGSALATALTAAQALDVDAAGRRAFRALRHGVESASTTLPDTVPADERRAWVLLQVTRLLFLRFVEAEGWLDGRADFLITGFDQCLESGRHPERDFLRPLFHGTLNRTSGARSRLARSFGAVPFLNGGLFEPHPIERRRRWLLPIAAWRRLFSLLVESFEVTLEQGDVGDRVSPELMGRVFEGVMEPVTRRQGGTYYTPSELVPAVVRDAVAVHLASRLGRPEEQVWRDLADPDPRLLAAMTTLRLLDPACGSGAFLVGGLQLLAGPARGAARVRALVTTRIFGVDRNPAAVRIAELRLWLELLRTMRHRPIDRVTPLPNLDTTIRVGDALLDPFAGTRIPAAVRRRLHHLRGAARTQHGAVRRAVILRLHRLERRVARAALDQRIVQLRGALADLRAGNASPDLFGTTMPPTHGVRQRLRALRRAMAELRTARRRLALDEAAPSFGIESAFASVMARGGFDLVVGNPPWVRAERLPPELRARLSGRYRWWRSAGAGWRHAPDLAVAFVERGMELLAPGGTMGFLVPSKLATADYATHARAGILQRGTLEVLADLADDPRAHFEATTYPLALVVTRRPRPTRHAVRLGLGPEAPPVPGEHYATGTAWPLGSATLQRLAARLSNQPTLATTLHPALGVKTGANAVFLDPDPVVERWTRPAIRGRDVGPLAASPSVRMLWPADQHGRPFPVLPGPLAAHLGQARSRLERRSDFRGGPWWQLFRTGSATGRWRVVWADLAPQLSAAPLPDPAPVPLNTCYVVEVGDAAVMHALAAWLCAAPIRALARLRAEPAANGYARFGARAVGGVPLPAAILDDPLLQELGAARWSPRLAAALDAHVSRRLELSRAECEVTGALHAPGG